MIASAPLTKRLRRLLAVTALAPCLLGASLPAAHADMALPAFDVTSPADGAVGQLDVTAAPDGSVRFFYGKLNQGLATRLRDASGALGVERTVTDDGYNPKVAAAAGGAAQFSWQVKTAAGDVVVRTRRMNADGTLGQTYELSSAGVDAYSDAVVLDASGTATVVWSRELNAGAIVQGRRSKPDGTWGKVENLSVTADSFEDPDLAIDAGGNVFVVWAAYENGVAPAVKARRWAANGSIGAIRTLSAPGVASQAPAVAIDDTGTAHVVWRDDEGGKVCWFEASGMLRSPQRIAELATDAPIEIELARAPGRGVQAVWTTFRNGQPLVQTRRVAADRQRGEVQTLGTYELPLNEVVTPAIAVDAAGDATAIWRSAVPGEKQMRLLARTTRADATLEPLQVLEEPDEEITSVGWYPKVVAGETGLAVTGWVADTAVGSKVRGAVGLVPAPPVVETPVEQKGTVDPPREEPVTHPGLGVDPVTPSLSGLRIARRVRMAGRLGVSFVLSHDARVTFTVLRRGGGRMIGGTCRSRTKSNAKRRACDLRVPGSVSVDAAAGTRTTRLATRLGGRALRPGHYRLVAQARHANGRASAPVRAAFTVVRRTR